MCMTSISNSIEYRFIHNIINKQITVLVLDCAIKCHGDSDYEKAMTHVLFPHPSLSSFACLPLRSLHTNDLKILKGRAEIIKNNVLTRIKIIPLNHQSW